MRHQDLATGSVFIIDGPNGEPVACRWTKRPGHAFETVGFEAVVHGSAIRDLGVYDPMSDAFRIPMRWREHVGRRCDVRGIGMDFDVESGMIIIDGPRSFPTIHG